jgi:hypothetical protein
VLILVELFIDRFLWLFQDYHINKGDGEGEGMKSSVQPPHKSDHVNI